MTTLADVAKLAGVSKATASRALSRHELVAPDTVARVRRAAAELGFVPNRAASHLARGRSGIIALVVPTLENSFFTPIIAGAQERAAEADLQLTVAVHAFDSEEGLQRIHRLARQVDGLVLVAPRGDDEAVRAMVASTPVVIVDREIDGLRSIVADTAAAFGALVEHLIGAGHRSIAYLGGPGGSWQDQQRTAAVQRASTGRAELAVLGPFPATFGAGAGACDDVLASGATAVVPYATAIGLGLVFALRARGVDSPGDVVVSAERLVADALGGAEVPSIDVDGHGLGRAAMDALLGSLVDREATVGSERLPVGLHLPEAAASARRR